MELIKLNLEPRPLPSPLKRRAGQISSPIDAPTTTSEPVNPVDLPQHAAVAAATDPQPKAVFTATAGISISEEPPVPLRHGAPLASSGPAEWGLPAPTTDASGTSMQLDSSAATADLAQESRMLLQQNVAPNASPAETEPALAEAMTVIKAEAAGTLAQHDAVSAATAAALEQHLTTAEATVHPEGPSDLLSHQTFPVSSSLPVETGFAYHSVSTGIFPARGLLYSVVGHGIAILALVLLWPKHVPPIYDPPRHLELTMIPKDALYLPALGGGDSGSPQRGAAAKSETTPSLSVADLSKLGVSFPGTQAIVSNPPHPTNKVQTILQPELSNPPELTKFVRLPNVVRLAENSPAPQLTSAADAPKADPSIEAPVPHSAPSAPTIPPLRALAPVVIETPKLSLPMAAPMNSSAMQVTAVPPVAPVPPQPAQARVLPGSSGREHRTLIALSVVPGPPDPSPKVPSAEAHGQFAVVALPNLAVSQLGIGSAAEAANPSAGAGAHANPSAHDATGAGTMAMGSDARPTAAGAGAVAGPGPGAADSGEGRNVAGAASGGMAIRGAAYGSGPGVGSASGAGKGAGPAPGAFAGMTIQGGEWPNGTPAEIAPQPPAKPSQAGSYGLTVVSSGNSGSGLGDFGVFFNEPVFTVYVNMTTPSDSTAPSWTLVYAALHRDEAGGAKIAAPFPTKRETPRWTADLAEHYRNQLVVIYLVITESGKVQRAKSMESPSAQLVAPLLAALDSWEFRPATLNGKPIAVRALLGVPVAAEPLAAPPSAQQTLSENKP